MTKQEFVTASKILTEVWRKDDYPTAKLEALWNLIQKCDLIAYMEALKQLVLQEQHSPAPIVIARLTAENQRFIDLKTPVYASTKACPICDGTGQMLAHAITTGTEDERGKPMWVAGYDYGFACSCPRGEVYAKHADRWSDKLRVSFRPVNERSQPSEETLAELDRLFPVRGKSTKSAADEIMRKIGAEQ